MIPYTREQEIKALEDGQIVKVDCHHNEYGRICTMGTIIDLRGNRARLALVNLDGPVQGFCHINVLIPKKCLYWPTLF